MKPISRALSLFSNKLDFRRALLRLTVAPVALLFVFTVVVLISNRMLMDMNADVARSRNTVKTAHELLLSYLNMETGFRGYVASRNEKFLDIYWEGKANAPKSVESLKKLCAQNPHHLAAISTIEKLMGRWQGYADRVRRQLARDTSGALPQAFSDGTGKNLMDAIREQMAGITNSEEFSYFQKGEHVHQVVRTATSVTLGLLLIAGFFLILHTQREIRHLSADFQLNITRAKEAHEELRHTNDGLERTVASRTAELEAFCYSVSHDLRAPLRGIDGFSLALVEDYGGQLPEQAQKYLQYVRQGVQKMGRLIDDLLNLSRVSRIELNLRPVNLTQIADEVASDLNGEAARKVEFASTPTVKVVGDEGMLRAMLTNLLTNAWKFTQKKDRAQVEFGQMEKAGEAVFYLRDNGAGFDMAHYGKLFGAFQRLHSPNEFTGTGIGLATVKRIAGRHGGEVWAESKVGEGATFFFKLGNPGLQNHPGA